MHVAGKAPPRSITRISSWHPRSRLQERVVVSRAFNIRKTSVEAAKAGSTALLASLLLATSQVGPAEARERVVRAPLAPTAELQGTQRVMIEAWNLIRTTYVDPSFNHVDWERDLTERLGRVATSETRDQGERELTELVGDLGDVYTRWIPANKYQEFLNDSINSEVNGVGLLIASDPVSGKHVVLNPISGGPAARAGIQKGDEIVRVNGTTLETSDEVGKALRGKQGSSVELEIARQIPGEVNDRLSEEDKILRKKFRLKRQRVSMSPVFATALHTDDNRTVGYIRALQFSKALSHDVEVAIRQLTKDGSEGIILDLRNNPGGLVTSALDVAGLFMNADEHPTVFSVSGRGTDGNGSEDVKLDGNARALSNAPMAVLVNGQSASASEILAGALKDNARAEVIGDSRTFGKARIQSVYELADGSGLVRDHSPALLLFMHSPAPLVHRQFVTVAKYLTPAGVDINKTGITPSMSCSVSDGSRSLQASIPVAPGLVGADPAVLHEIENDPCVLTAMAVDLKQSLH